LLLPETFSFSIFLIEKSVSRIEVLISTFATGYDVAAFEGQLSEAGRDYEIVSEFLHEVTISNSV
jgi:hypothetical protein